MALASDPIVVADPDRAGTAAVLLPVAGDLPRIGWVGAAAGCPAPSDVAAVVGTSGAAASVHVAAGRSIPTLLEVSDSWLGRPGLAGHRLSGESAGRDWATSFATTSIDARDGSTVIQARDDLAGLALSTEFEAVSGGALRVRHVLTNLRPQPYVVDALDVVVPVPDRVTEVLDTSGRWGRERNPQRHVVRDGVWLRESRGGRPGHDAVTELVAGTAGFGFRSGEVWALHVAWSGNTRHFLERRPSGVVTLGGGEVLLPGEVVLGDGADYATPWVFVAASAHGLDGVAAQLHDYVRSLPAHPGSPRPVTSNVWEAVYFDHDLDRLRHLADLAASLGIERFVLDDGWFGERRNDRAGLGDWTASPDAWPDGLGPLVDHVRDLRMQFGLWFEPEMVNRESELFRAHPEWILAVNGRPPPEFRNQLVLDLGRAQVRDHLYDAMHAVLAQYPISFVKWDHNRDLPEAAAGDRHGAPGAHAQTLGFYALLDRLRAAHPDVEWESCASGGGRIDLAVLERVERVWTSDMTDALARQGIQRWTGQLVPPEYLGAHVSAPVNHQTGRALSLDFRAATAFFGDLGVEWDVASATPDERARLAAWIDAYKNHRALLHSGRVVRVDSTEDSIWMYGVVSRDHREAIMAYVQLDETVHDPLPFLVPGLDPDLRYTARAIGPTANSADAAWRGEGLTVSGATLMALGLPAPSRRAQTALLVQLQAG